MSNPKGIKEPKKETYYDRLVFRIKNSKFIAVLLICGACVIALATFTESLGKLFNRASPGSSSQSAPGTRTPPSEPIVPSRESNTDTRPPKPGPQHTSTSAYKTIQFDGQTWHWQGNGRVNTDGDKRDPKNQWLEIDTKHGEVLLWSKHSTDLRTAPFSVSLDLMRGDRKKDFGLVFGLKDPDNYWAFTIKSEGSFRIFAIKDGNNDVLVPWTESAKIRPYANKTNQLAISADGTAIRFSINDIMVSKFDLPGVLHGKVGIYADHADMALDIHSHR
ncbi:MAG: hypothetical protein QNJ97_17100 [Myxococcota bacterium]|nr:hypothetical protein [Myxococcota bacterium]